MKSMQKRSDRQEARRGTACPYPKCPAQGVDLLDASGSALPGKFLREVKQAQLPPVTSIVFGVPKSADLETYLDFTHLYLPAPTEYLVPHQSWILIRHRGSIGFAKRAEWATYNERHRRSEDPNFISNRGTDLMAPGHVVTVGPAVPIVEAFRWIDSRYENGLQPGSIYDPLGGEPFHWQLSMVVTTSDLRRKAKRPFTVIRRRDLMMPASSSRPERALRNGLIHEGVAVCRHLRSLRVSERYVDPDIAVPGLQTVIEYDGAYWHRGAKNRDRDKRKSERLLDAGWKVIRLREAGLERLDLKRRGFRQVSLPDSPNHQSALAMALDLLP